ncbi:MAG: branched-chain amino acid ABC transporter permease [Synergistetes bacterium]|nr:branched-chain amino acid ABC transporter permease [Synergistota bacterium]MCX8127980.1 branched-chain amino acid ABC transporter permease [Synergistota bacterium]MDW8192825.1 branched-chain amino acid ABC transporter permease [Synergistota bacterium]
MIAIDREALIRKREKIRLFLNVILIGIFLVFLSFAEDVLDPYTVRILNVSAVYMVLAMAYNLVNGILGQFMLGPNAFIALGAYTVALLTMPIDKKAISYIIEPLIWPLNSICWPLFPSLIAAGILSAAAAYLLGIPSFKLKGDYLAIVTLGFGEMVVVLANNLVPITNGALGLKDIPRYVNLYWTWGCALLTYFFMRLLRSSTYGRAFESIREDEIAAEGVGIDVKRHKLLALTISGFFLGVGGGLLASLLGTIDPKLFSFFFTFNLLIIVVLGGLGSFTGAAIASIIFVVLSELLRAVESPINIGPIHIPGIPGMRMVVFSVLLIIVMLYWQRGLLGRKEISWDFILNRLYPLKEVEEVEGSS